ncbi:DNA-processing protein DprA [Arcanobacterium ihumii]|uniref:DNA-processing protein DprA n=1 Tax=Arcanobacterium ihumii TaxID=2138162 RepID=UPI000F525159|nr:DNA-processing protein DprA [Arcanobacterium ihumii]
MVNTGSHLAATLDEEHMAAVTWSRITEAEDIAAFRWINHFGYRGGIDVLKEEINQFNASTFDDGLAGSNFSEAFNRSIQRWASRLQNLSAFNYDVLPKLGITILIPQDCDWPRQLNDLGERRPLCLWVRGNVEALQLPMVSIVGSRDASSVGKRFTLDISHDISDKYVVVSGGAFGIDAFAHEGALAAAGKTIIVSAGGVDRAYPKANEQLFNDALNQGGAVVSESPLAASPQRHRFLARNRIIAALGSGTLVVEASFRSGALNTARHALELGREVGAVPGSIESHFSSGCHELIRNGGILVSSSQHLREMLGSIGEVNNGQGVQVDDAFAGAFKNGYDPILERVFDAVPQVRGAAVQNIARLSGLNEDDVQSALGKLLIMNRVIFRNGRWVKG